LLEVRDRYFEEEPFEFDFFGTESHEFSKHPPREGAYYSGPAEFEDLYIGLGNNVFEQDDFRASLGYLPKPAWQLLGKLVGVVPGFAIYADGRSDRANELYQVRLAVLGFSIFALAGLLAYPTHFLWHFKEKASSDE
jgi:hypothetical protein